MKPGQDMAGEQRASVMSAADVEQTVMRLRAFNGERGDWLFERAPMALSEAAALFLSERTGLMAYSLTGFPGKAVEAGKRIGMEPTMVREALGNFFAPVTKDALEDLRAAQLACSPPSRVLKPALVFHVLAGNLFLPGIESMMTASLCGACSLARCSSADREFPALWIDALRTVDAEFARGTAAGWWPHDERDVTRAAARDADAVVAFGDDSSVADVLAHAPPTARRIAHGARISFAIIAREGLESGNVPVIARALAYDFTVYDQQGCLSPRAAFIENGGGVTPAEFARLLCAEMAALAERLPRRALALEEKAALAQARDDALIEAACGGAEPGGVLLSATDQPDGVLADRSFIVTLRALKGYAPGCVNRCCDLRVFSEAGALRAALTPWRGRISTLALCGSQLRWQETADELRAARICAPGQMQKPPLGWPHDNRPALSDLVRYACADPIP
ncbi:MAG: hypothetical protein NTY46_08615 [Candidatus Sumerlaeota bacterium]|nr:hypothetical protein [Candidatus Sumerlaeota bacterium]